LIPFAAILILTWLSAAVFTKQAAFRESRTFLTEQASAVLRTLLDVSGAVTDQQDLDGNDARTLMVWRDDQLVFSRNVMDRAMPTGRSSVVEMIGQENWVIVTDCNGSTCALVGIRDTERKMAIRRLVAVIYLPLLALLGLSLWGAKIVVHQAVEPIKDVSKSVRDMEVDNLEPLDMGEVDQELEPLVNAINHLMGRMRQQLEQERSFLSLYAHEIRTPIAGLDAQMQLLKDELSEPSQTFDNVLNCSARTVRVANQLLALARSKNAAAMPLSGDALNFVEQLRNTMAEVVCLHGDVDLTLSADTEIWMTINPFIADVIFRNLLDNAIHYGRPREGSPQILVSCTAHDQMMHLEVEDNGEGLTADQIEMAKKAFHRVRGKENPFGTGLGLSIVIQMVEGLGGQLMLDHSPVLGGLRVSIALPFTVNQTSFAAVECSKPSRDTISFR
jgi:signal transduction histidine kinase